MRARNLIRIGLVSLLAGALLVSSTHAAIAPQPPLDPALKKLHRQVVHDRDLARKGKLRLGALSDGNFNVYVEESKGRVLIEMPPLRAKRLRATRNLIAARYGSKPVRIRLAPRVTPRQSRDPRTAPKPGRPFSCSGEPIFKGTPGEMRRGPIRQMAPSHTDDWNAKKIIGMRLPASQRLARRHGCALRVTLVDGMTLVVPGDYLSNRMKVAVRHGRITHILGLG